MNSLNQIDKTQDSPKLLENIDYYWEHGKMVLTATFLKNRGFCCKNGCRHCPYGCSNRDSLKKVEKD